MAERSYWSNRFSSGWSRRRFIQAAGLGTASLGAYALAACGGTSNNGNKGGAASATAQRAATTPQAGAQAAGSPAATTAGAAASAAANLGEPKTGGTVSVAFVGATSEQPNQDPQQTATLLLHNLGSGVAYSRLVKLKVGPDVPVGARVPIGDLAASWETPDPTTYIFHLRPEAKWQNIAPVSGRAVTADDVVYSFNRQRDLKVNTSTLGDVAQMQAVDPRTFKMTLNGPNVDFIVAIGETYNKVIAHEAVEAKGDLKDGPTIGSGAWIQTDWQSGSVIKFKKNPDYFGKDAQGRQLPYADNLQILRIPDVSTGLAAFRTKQYLVYGYYSTVNKPDFDQLRNEHPELMVEQTAGIGTGIRLVSRVNVQQTMDVRVRQAILKSIDRQALLDGVSFGEGWYTSDIVPPAPDWILSQNELKKTLAKDIQGAKQLLQAAGVSGWNPELKFLFLPPDKAAAELLPQMLQQINIKPNLNTCDNVCHASGLQQGDFDLLVTEGLRGTTTTADLLLFHKTGGSRNGARESDPQLDSLIDAQARETDENKRRDVFNQIQHKVLDLAAYIPLIQRGGAATSQLIWPQLKNWWPQVSGEYMQYEIVWLG